MLSMPGLIRQKCFALFLRFRQLRFFGEEVIAGKAMRREPDALHFPSLAKENEQNNDQREN